MQYNNSEAGFSLIEAIIAILMMTISVFGIVTIFTFAVKYNANNKLRTQALAIAQSKIEILRTARFSDAVTDAVLAGANQTVVTDTDENGFQYLTSITIDDDPFTAGIQINAAANLKEITLSVTPRNADSWVAGNPIRIVTRRARAN